MAYVITDDCNQCGACVAGCESSAISEGPNKNTIDINVCIECGLCHSNCPFGAIIWEDDPPQQASASSAG